MKYSYCITSVGVTDDVETIKDLVPSGMNRDKWFKEALEKGEGELIHGQGSRTGTLKFSIRILNEKTGELK